ncbi:MULTISPECIES: alpha/beta hydrolase [Pseudomonas]|uniref:Carboxylesterase NlhH n=3 Tax=Pseudomonas TaxID=286 RepID=A0A5M9J200_9PSED|nr:MULTISPECIES: alpha/beta hydrolase [Pseudomonas]KAA6167453.1 alpha/beta hydrolase [Pseudomonas veronii]KAA6180198.1 alpha/beta hydrolase [Pseudomonas veronii]KAA8563058.1 Carboxylesterase NlhH [Pseudomonas extremaustralis]
MTPEQARKEVRDAVVMEVSDLTLATEGRPVGVRLYRPARPAPAPVLMYFHGGGWVTGDLDTHDSFCRVMSEWAGCAVVAVDYPRPPEHRFPAAVKSCYTATAWIARNGASLGLDPQRIAVAGGGSGGGLAAVICQMARDLGAPPIGFQLLLYPVLDCLARNRSRRNFANGFGLTAELMDWYLDQYVPPGIPLGHPWLSPARDTSLQGLPAALIITAGCDLLRDEGRAFARGLKRAGVPVQHKEYTGMPHGFINYPATEASARRAVLLCAEALAGFFDPPPA